MSNDFLIQDARDLVATAENTAAVKDYYRTLPLGQIWQAGARSGRHQILHQEHSFHDAVTRLQEILFVHSPSPREAELAVKWYLNFNYQGPEASEIVPENSTVRLGGKRYWHDDFRHAETLNRINIYAPDKPDTFVELGAGCGGLARLVKLRYPDIRYVIIDLPDTLAYAMMFLRATFPEATWCWLDGATSGVGDYDFVFCPVGLEYLLHGMRFDAFINTASLGEMRTETVHHWFDFVQEKCRFDWIFSVNRFLNAVSPEQAVYRREENGHAFAFDNRWAILDWELSPLFLRCPWMNRHARQALIFGKRLAEPLKYDYHLLLDALAGSWNHAENDMTNFAPPITENFTMADVLFRLWEAVRLNPSEETKVALKRYMAFLAPSAVLEDAFHL